MNAFLSRHLLLFQMNCSDSQSTANLLNMTRNLFHKYSNFVDALMQCLKKVHYAPTVGRRRLRMQSTILVLNFDKDDIFQL